MSTQLQLSFIQDIATLLRAGTAQEQALKLLAEHHPEPDFKQLLSYVLEQVQQGATLSDSIENSRELDLEQFSPLVISMIRSGEAGGNLPSALDKLAEQLERDHEIKQNIVSSLIYPAILVLGMFFALLILFAVVVPQFSELLETSSQQLNTMGTILLAVGNFFNQWGLWILAIIIIGSIACFAGIKSGKLEVSISGLVQKLPLLRNLHTQIDYVRFCYGLSSLLESGLTQTQSLKIAASGLSNASSKEQASDIVNQLNAGSTLGDCFTSLKEFNPIYAHSIANAEQAGELSNALRTIAERMERDFADKALRLTQLVEPVLILVMGVLIGLIVYGLFSAISGLSTTI